MWNKWAKRQNRTDIVHRPGSGCTDTCSRFQGLDTAKYRPSTLERGSRCISRGRRVVRGRRDDDRTRRRDRHSGFFLHFRRWPRDGRGRDRSATDFSAGATILCHILDTVPSERSSTLHRRLEVSSVPEVVQAAEGRDRV